MTISHEPYDGRSTQLPFPSVCSPVKHSKHSSTFLTRLAPVLTPPLLFNIPIIFCLTLNWKTTQFGIFSSIVSFFSALAPNLASGDRVPPPLLRHGPKFPSLCLPSALAFPLMLYSEEGSRDNMSSMTYHSCPKRPVRSSIASTLQYSREGATPYLGL